MSGKTPSEVACHVALLTLASCWILRILSKALDITIEHGALQSILAVLKRLPIVSGIVRKEKEKIYKKLQGQVHAQRYGSCDVPKFTALPQKAFTFKQVFKTIDAIEVR